MKYESRLDKRFHADIVGALRCAFRNDNIIPQHKNDGDASILREYLKKRYANSGGLVTNEYTYNVVTYAFTVSGVTLTFNVRFENGGTDKELALSWSQLRTFVGSNMDELFPPKKKGKDKPVQDVPEDKQLPVAPDRAAELAGSFNYAVLSAEMGDYLKQLEQKLRNEYMNFTANCGAIFAEAQKRLAKGGHGTFLKWVEYLGFKPATVYRAMDVYKFRLSLIDKDENADFFDELPKYLQYDISAPSAPAELVDKVMSGDITTHKEYIALKKQLEEQAERAEKAERASEQNHRDYIEESKHSAELTRANHVLKNRVEELENQPRDVYCDVDEVNRRVKEASDIMQKQTLEMQRLHNIETAGLTSTINDLRDELDKLKENAPAGKSGRKLFVISCSRDGFNMLVKALENAPDLQKIIKNAKLLSIEEK